MVWGKIFTIVFLFLGEAISIYTEVLGARLFSNAHANSLFIGGKTLPSMIIGAIFLLIGYLIGIRSFTSIWLVSAISIASIVLTEPTVDLLLFHQLPTRGATISLTLGIFALIASLF